MKKTLIGIASMTAVLFALSSGSALAATTVVGLPVDMAGWGFLQETPTATAMELVAGPSGVPLGMGSARLAVDGTGGAMIGKAGYNGVELADITELEYSTYRTSGSAPLAIALQFNIDNNVIDLDNAWKGRLVYEPYHTQAVSTGVWETWDALDDSAGTGTGNWWGTGAVVAASCPQSNPCTWAEVLAAFPDAGIHNVFGAVLLKAGGGWAGGFDGNTDALKIGVGADTTTYDFETDGDGDGIVDDGTDLCLGTVDGSDSFPEFGKSKGRYEWNGSEWISSGKGATGFNPDMAYTYGCSGKQILDRLVEATGLPFDGHYKFGVTKSILEDWRNGTYFLETMTIPAAQDTDTLSSAVLKSGEEYVVKAYGTADACIFGCGYSIFFDPEYSTSDGTTWVDGVAAPYVSYGPNLLDLMVNGGYVGWGAFSPTHTYTNTVAGADVPLALRVNDVFYPNNSGNLSADISVKLW